MESADPLGFIAQQGWNRGLPWSGEGIFGAVQWSRSTPRHSNTSDNKTMDIVKTHSDTSLKWDGSDKHQHAFLPVIY